MALLIVLAGLIDAITSMGIAARDNRTVQIIHSKEQRKLGNLQPEHYPEGFHMVEIIEQQS